MHHGPPGPFSMPGTSENNSAVQVIPTPAALVSYFQVLFLDFFKVLQQLCVVDAGGVTFLGLGGSFQTVSRKTDEVRVSICIMVVTGGIQLLGICVSDQWHLPSSQAIVLGVPSTPPFLQLVGTANPLLGYLLACGLLMEPRAGIAWGSISCLPVAPFGVRARASSQPGSQLGPGTGSGEKGEAQPSPFSAVWLGLQTAGITEVFLLGPATWHWVPRPVVTTCSRRRGAFLTT